jgi:hypothetical protein
MRILLLKFGHKRLPRLSKLALRCKRGDRIAFSLFDTGFEVLRRSDVGTKYNMVEEEPWVLCFVVGISCSCGRRFEENLEEVLASTPPRAIEYEYTLQLGTPAQ